MLVYCTETNLIEIGQKSNDEVFKTKKLTKVGTELMRSIFIRHESHYFQF